LFTFTFFVFDTWNS